VSEYKKTYYSNGNFVNNRKFNDSFYKMLADNFIKMSNRERLKLLDELYNKTNKTNKTKL